MEIGELSPIVIMSEEIDGHKFELSVTGLGHIVYLVFPSGRRRCMCSFTSIFRDNMNDEPEIVNYEPLFKDNPFEAKISEKLDKFVERSHQYAKMCFIVEM